MFESQQGRSLFSINMPRLIMITVLWDVTPCTCLLRTSIRRNLLPPPSSFTLQMEAAGYTDMLLPINQTLWCHIQKIFIFITNRTSSSASLSFYPLSTENSTYLLSQNTEPYYRCYKLKTKHWTDIYSKFTSVFCKAYPLLRSFFIIFPILFTVYFSFSLMRRFLQKYDKIVLL